MTDRLSPTRESPFVFEGIPVLVLAFRRADVLAKTLEALRLASPSAIYVNVDGPRGDVSEDATNVLRVHQLLDDFEAECPVHLRYNESNRGLGVGVCEAIDWFFSFEHHGVILEDDVYISSSSLDLARLLLLEFESHDDVGSISLFNPVPTGVIREPQATYRFSSIPSSQYWGTWRNRWRTSRELRDPKQARIPEKMLSEVGGKRFAQMYLASWSSTTSVDEISWEGRWLATHFSQGWIVPTTNANYSLHLGFNSLATNSIEQPSWYPTELSEWNGALDAPFTNQVDRHADRWYLNRRFGLSAQMRFRRTVRRLFPGLTTFWRGRMVKQIQPPDSTKEQNGLDAFRQ